MLMGARSASLVRAPAASNNNKNRNNERKRKSMMVNVGDVFVIIMITMVSSTSIIRPCTSISSASDAEALLKFRASLNNNNNGIALLSSWDDASNRPPCRGDIPNWEGLFCIKDKVWGLRLENMGLSGRIDMDSLGSMSGLRMISLINNTFGGPLPQIQMLPNLKALFLSFNHFSGDIPDNAFAGLHKLRKLVLSHNDFVGQIPSSIASLPSLLELALDSNKFQGQIPDFPPITHAGLKKVNFSNNDLEGPIPPNLSKFSAFSFRGNARLCGPPLTNPCQGSADAKTGSNNNKVQTLKTVLIVIIVVLLLVVVVGALVIWRMRQKNNTRTVVVDDNDREDQQVSSMTTTLQAQAQAQAQGGQASKSVVVYGKTKSLAEHYESTSPRQHDGHNNNNKSGGGSSSKLIFLRHDETLRFDLQDLLKASAEILGSASFGSSYKAVLLDGQASVVVKRYKHMNNLPREDFHEHMRRLGNLNHPNLLPLTAYYYRKEEKLLISAFVQNGCLASHLHGKRTNINKHQQQQNGLDWPTRLKIVKGVARGLGYLFNALPSIVVPHGHIKSSNILLDESFEPLITDYGLCPVINTERAQQIIMPYKSPEYAQLGRITRKTDVWSFGILILEILTGKFPENYLTQKHTTDSDIASWVNTMITEKRTGEVFDVDMGGVHNSKAELLKLLKIGLSCCEENVERRLDMKEALEHIEELKEGASSDDDNNDGEFSSTVIITSERDAYRAAV